MELGTTLISNRSVQILTRSFVKNRAALCGTAQVPVVSDADGHESAVPPSNNKRRLLGSLLNISHCYDAARVAALRCLELFYFKRIPRK